MSVLHRGTAIVSVGRIVHGVKAGSRCILRNGVLMNRPYTWELTINVEVELKPKEITDLWTKVCRKLKKYGVVALWVREPGPSNHCNYHLIVSTNQTKVDLEQSVEAQYAGSIGGEMAPAHQGLPRDTLNRTCKPRFIPV